MPRIFSVLIITAILLTACSGGQPTRAAVEAPEAAATTPVSVAPRTPSAPAGGPAAASQPRLWFPATDLPRPRAWATAANPLHRAGLAPLAERAVREMDEKRVPDQACGNVDYEEYPAEM